MTAEKTNPLAHQPPARTDFSQSDLLAECKDQMSAEQLVAHCEAGELEAPQPAHEQRIDALLKLRNARNSNREKEA